MTDILAVRTYNWVTGPNSRYDPVPAVGVALEIVLNEAFAREFTEGATEDRVEALRKIFHDYYWAFCNSARAIRGTIAASHEIRSTAHVQHMFETAIDEFLRNTPSEFQERVRSRIAVDMPALSHMITRLAYVGTSSAAWGDTPDQCVRDLAVLFGEFFIVLPPALFVTRQVADFTPTSTWLTVARPDYFDE